MESVHIHGGVTLQGRVPIQGSKNAALPVLAATLLTKEGSYIRGCPRIADVHKMIQLLRSLGCRVVWREDGVYAQAASVCAGEMPGEAIRGMRSSLCLLGAVIGRCGSVVMEYPGGCVIGDRPIDLHIWALQQMGVEFSEAEGKLHAVTQGLHGADIHFPLPSVGATENVLLAAVMAEGNTRIEGAAREPEVEALGRFLNLCGADIRGLGSTTLTVCGGRRLYGADYRIPADRIVAGTYVLACAAAGGSILLEGAPVDQMGAVLSFAEQTGVQWTTDGDGLYIQSEGRPASVPLLRTEIYPGFPTDLQSMALVVLAEGRGDSRVEETIFENRFRVVEPLCRMGADIELLDKRNVLVHGVERLQGCRVEARELRGGAALVLAGLAAEGETIVDGGLYIDRGYENICKDFRELGARIISV